MPIFEIVLSRPLPSALTTLQLGLARPSSKSSPTVSNITYGLIALAP